MSETETIPGFENKVLIDPQRLRQLEDVYKERLTENLPLAKAARIAAKQEAILMSDQIPPGVKKALATPLANEKKLWTKAVRQPVGFGPDADDERDAEADAYAQGPLHSMLTQLVQKKKKKKTTTPETTPSAPPKAKKRLRFATQPKAAPPKKKKKTTKKSPPKTPVPSVDWGHLPFQGDPRMMGDSVADYAETTAKSVKKKIRKKAGRRRPTETDKLQRPPGWLDFDKKLKRRLDGEDY